MVKSARGSIKTRLINSKGFLRIIIILIALSLLFQLARFLLSINTDNFLSTYKYFTTDSYDWIANGLHFFDSTMTSNRNPGLPLIIYFLSQFHVLFLLPLINSLGVIIASASVSLTVYKKTNSQLVSIATYLMLFLNFDVQSFSNYVLSDFWAVTFICVSVYFIEKKDLFKSALALGLSALFQSFAFFVLPAFALAIFVQSTRIKLHNGDLGVAFFSKSCKKVLKYIALFILPTALFWGRNLLKYGSPFYTQVVQFRFLHPDLDGILYYSYSMLDIFSIMGVLLAIISIVYIIVKKKREYTLNVLALACALIFWVIFYDWNDKRFMLYLIPFITIIIANGINILWQQKKTRLIAVIVTLILILQVSIPNDSFFNTATVQLLPQVNLKAKTEFREGQGDVILSNPIFERKSGAETLKKYPLIFEYLNSKQLKNSTNKYYDYTQYLIQNYQHNTLCLSKDSGFETGIMNSILLINYNLGFDDIQIIEENCK